MMKFQSSLTPFGSDLIPMILLEWLDAKSLNALDVAIVNGDDHLIRPSNRELKAIWMNCLKRAISLRALNELDYDYLWLEWIIKRRVKPEILTSIKSRMHRSRALPSIRFKALIYPVAGILQTPQSTIFSQAVLSYSVSN
jgi:hypothetical protein